MTLPITTVLVDRRNFDDLLPSIIDAVRSVSFCGLDCETEDDARHEGLNILCKYDETTRHKKRGKLVFDMRRIVMCGFSIFPEGGDTAWYFNLAHADVENRLTWEEVKPILDAKPANASWLCHNAPFELTVFKSCHGYELHDVICTMQLSVTAFGDDEYDLTTFKAAGLGAMEKMVYPLIKASRVHRRGEAIKGELLELINNITSKESTSAHNINGWIDEMAYGHGLKDLVRVFFAHKMGTFAETLGEEPHMGRLTGEQVAEYGAEDAYWVVPLFRHLLGYIAQHSPDAFGAFFDTENPMAQVFSDIWLGGMRVNSDAIFSRREVERAQYAAHLRDLRAAMRELGSFSAEPVAWLAEKQPKWYGDGKHARYREKISSWVDQDDTEDDYEECLRVSSAVSNAWADERKLKRKTDTLLSITHYMPVRTIIYDLIGAKGVYLKGDLQSDGECRAKIKAYYEGLVAEAPTEIEGRVHWGADPDQAPTPVTGLTSRNQAVVRVLELLTALTSVEQRMKLYLTPYLLLTDPETQRMYPVANSLLNSRRIALSSPNGNQLAKRGESTYVRGFFLGDTDDHLIVSLDWSAIELVIIGEMSGDPGFFKAFGQLPHDDMHAGTAADILKVEMPWMDEEKFKSLREFTKVNDFLDRWSLQPEDAERLFTNLKGEPIIDPGKARGYWRTEIGKGANFNYWFSGFLTTVGERMGWSMEQTSQATSLYRDRFSVAEDWRVDTIHHGQRYGWVQLPDGHRRHKYEAMYEWAEYFRAKWPNDEDLQPAINEVIKRVQRRANNQLVNSLVQGTCATLLKRSILRTKTKLKAEGWTDNEARLMMPNHDEMVFSVKWNMVPEFIAIARGVMIDHTDLFPTLKLDATPAVGRTFEPWSAKAPFGQVELFEAPEASFITPGRQGERLTDDEVREVCQFLRHGEAKRIAA
jgi:DNA polymerase I-like protein with 3'-5' exonuclease and polymerase domains